MKSLGSAAATGLEEGAARPRTSGHPPARCGSVVRVRPCLAPGCASWRAVLSPRGVRSGTSSFGRSLQQQQRQLRTLRTLLLSLFPPKQTPKGTSERRNDTPQPEVPSTSAGWDLGHGPCIISNPFPTKPMLRSRCVE